MTATGKAMAMRLELTMLIKRHRFTPAAFKAIALPPPVAGDVYIDGIASPVSIDRERMLFTAGCWTPFKSDIRLLYRHQDRVAGRILTLSATDAGLAVSAVLSDSYAKTCSHFSVCATVHDFEICSPDDPQRFHAKILSATLDEISLTPEPGNVDAVVRRTPAYLATYDLAGRGIRLMMQQLEILQQMVRAAPPSMPPAAVPAPPRIPRQPALPHRRGEFGRLVETLEKRS